MSEYVTLIGAEQVQRAGHNIASAAEQMLRAAMTIDEAMQRFQQLVERFEAAAAALSAGGGASG